MLISTTSPTVYIASAACTLSGSNSPHSWCNLTRMLNAASYVSHCMCHLLPPPPSARYISAVSSHSALHGLSLLGLFFYVYTANASFLIVSCRVTDEGYVRTAISYCFSAQMKNEGSHYILILYPSIVMYCTYTLPLPSRMPQSV